MLRTISAVTALALACALGPAVTPAAAGVDVDFGANVRLDDNTDVFFSISSRYFDRDRAVITDWNRRFRDPDDLSVFFFIVKHSGRSPDFVFSLRSQGLPWWDVGARCGVPVDVWFVPVAVDPGPPYGHAYGHWKKWKRDRKTKMVVRDVDARNLVAVRMVRDYYGVPGDTAMKWRAGGRNVRTLMASEYVKRHGSKGKRVERAEEVRGGKRDRRGEDDKDRDKGRGKGHGKK